jgi:hypothetical protein
LRAACPELREFARLVGRAKAECKKTVLHSGHEKPEICRQRPEVGSNELFHQPRSRGLLATTPQYSPTARLLRPGGLPYALGHESINETNAQLEYVPLGRPARLPQIIIQHSLGLAEVLSEFQAGLVRPRLY